MISRTWRLVLLVVALIVVIWPTFFGELSQWVAAVAIAILLIADIGCKECRTSPMSAGASRPARRSSRRRPARRRRR